MLNRFAIVKPSEFLLKKLQEQEVEFEEFYEPNSKTKDQESGKDESESDGESEALLNSQCNYMQTQDVLGMMSQDQDNNLNLTSNFKSRAIIIRGIHLHGLMLNLLNTYKPHNKNVKIVAPYSFNNSIHKTCDIISNSLVSSTKSSDEQTYSLVLKGLYDLHSVKKILRLLCEKYQGDDVGSNSTFDIKIYLKTLRHSETLNWPYGVSTSIKQLKAKVSKREAAKFYVEYN